MPPEPINDSETRIVSLPVTEQSQTSSPAGWKAFGRLLWSEWFAHSTLVLCFVVALPAVIFSFCFFFFSIPHSRAFFFSPLFWAVFISRAALRLVFWYKDFVGENLTGFFSCPLLALLALKFLWGGGLAYRRKEI